jgi:tight adherence protein B
MNPAQLEKVDVVANVALTGGSYYIYVVAVALIVGTAFVLFFNWMRGKSPRVKMTLLFINAMLLLLALTFRPETEFVVKMLLAMVINVFIYALMYIKDRKKIADIALLEDQLVNALLILSGSLKAGRTLQQGFELVAISLPAPISSEFSQVLQDQHVGVPFDEALKNLLLRVDSKDFKTFVTATLFQKETGGNIISLYDQITFAVAERKKLKGRLENLTVQGRYSGYLIAILPIVLFVFLYFTNPDYVAIFFSSDLPGNEVAKILLMVAVLLEIVGVLVIRNIVSRRLE